MARVGDFREFRSRMNVRILTMKKHAVQLVMYLILSSSLIMATSVEAETRGAHLTISAGGIPVSGDNPEHFLYLAGSYAQFLIVVCAPSGEVNQVQLRGRPVESPPGLKISVATEDLTAHPEWLPEMRIRSYLTRIESINDPARRNERKAKPGELGHEEYDFIFAIPVEAAGHRIFISAAFDHPTFGHLQTTGPAAMRIVAPTSDNDQELIRDSQICYLETAGEYYQAMALADSLIGLEYTGLRGLASAQAAAFFSRNYEAALRYMDLNMAANGAFEVERSGSDLAWPPVPKLSKDELRQQRSQRYQPLYQRLRKEYLQKIAEQQRSGGVPK